MLLAASVLSDAIDLSVGVGEYTVEPLKLLLFVSMDERGGEHIRDLGD